MARHKYAVRSIYFLENDKHTFTMDEGEQVIAVLSSHATTRPMEWRVTVLVEMPASPRPRSGAGRD